MICRILIITNIQHQTAIGLVDNISSVGETKGAFYFISLNQNVPLCSPPLTTHVGLAPVP
jgi:hypothetical protein